MEKGSNSKVLLRFVGYGLAIVGIGLWARRAYKKELEKVVDDSRENNGNSNEIRIPDENPDVKTEEQVATVIEEVEVERNFITDLYDATRSENSDVDESFTDIDKICKAKKKILHVMESLDKNSGYVCLKLMIEIPKYTNSLGNFNKLRIQDIITACRNSGSYVMAQKLKKCKKEAPIWSKMVVVMEYSYAIVGSDIRKIQILEIPNWILRKAYDDTEDQDGKKNNMAVRFFEDWGDAEKRTKVAEKVFDDIKGLLDIDAQRKAEDDGDTIVPGSVCAHPIELMYSLGFPKENIFSKEDDSFKMTLAQAEEIIDYYINTFVIQRTGKKMIPGSPVPVDEILDEFLIDGVMFHAPNKKGKFNSLARFYFTNSNGKLDIDSFKEGSRDGEEEVESEGPEREVTEADLEALKSAMSTKKK